jgi:hypothetical protein
MNQTDDTVTPSGLVILVKAGIQSSRGSRPTPGRLENLQ